MASENEKRETVADILAEYRNDADAMDRGWLYQPTTEYLRRLLDRIEAIDSADAWRSLYTPPIGNAAAMREALEFADRELRRATEDSRYGEDLLYLVGCMRSVARVCRAALSATPRNCDIGTTEEQSERFMDFCRPGNRPPNCEKCKVYPKRMNKFWCQLEWAQMPCEEGGEK